MIEITSMRLVRSKVDLFSFSPLQEELMRLVSGHFLEEFLSL